MKSLFHRSLAVLLVAFGVTGCFDKDRPNYHYFPNMYEPVPYEPYGAYEVFENEQEAKLPVEGTISRGWKPYGYENNPEGYSRAKEELKNPLPYTEENLAEGRQLYDIYCAVCHGSKGDGQGILVQREKILGIPSYDDPGRAITEGSTYHVVFYGLNMMGSYAAQVNERERWQITHYVMQLKNELEGKPAREFEQAETPDRLLPALNPASSVDEKTEIGNENESTN